MRLSESLRKGIMKSKVGGIINKFKIKGGRRDTLFFEELLARYILECEKQGFADETRKMGHDWMFLVTKTFSSKAIKKMPPVFILNSIMKNVWHNLGLMDDFHVEKNGDILRISTKNEGITRYMGENNLMMGLHAGNVEAFFQSSVHLLKMKQNRNECEYVFRLHGKPIYIEGRSKELYDKINEIKPIKGYTLKDVLKEKIFTLKGNRIYYRGKSMSPVENTLFHLIGQLNILPEKMEEISYDFFKEIIKPEVSKEEKLSLLKTLFQVMGWGLIRILLKKKGVIVVQIKNPPCGLLLKDNWDYLIRTFLGYMWLIDKELKISDIKTTASSISVKYSH